MPPFLSLGVKRENGQPRERRSFSDELKYRAGEILAATRGPPSRWSPQTALEDELRLLLRHLYLAQHLEERILAELLDRECDIGTELLALEHRTPRYATQRFPEREKIKRRLAELQRERRRFRERQAEKLACLEERLLKLVGRSRILAQPET